MQRKLCCPVSLAGILFIVLVSGLRAAPQASANYGIGASSTDAGGTQATSANYTNYGSIGGIAGLAVVGSPAETIKSGYIGQLYQAVSLTLDSAYLYGSVPQQLSAVQTLDDGTTVNLMGNAQSWSVVGGQIPAGLVLNASTGIISGIPAGAGSYSFTLLVADGLGHSSQQAFSGSGPASALGYGTWEAQPGFFTSQELANPSVSGVTVDPEGNGVPNLLKYLYDINPAAPMSPGDFSALPEVNFLTNNGVDYLTLTYRQYASAIGLTVNLQTSSDLINWQTVSPPDFAQQVGTDSNTGDPIITLGVKANASSKQFIRLRVISQ
jgi:hypothetical protein